MFLNNGRKTSFNQSLNQVLFLYKSNKNRHKLKFLRTCIEKKVWEVRILWHSKGQLQLFGLILLKDFVHIFFCCTLMTALTKQETNYFNGSLYYFRFSRKFRDFFFLNKFLKNLKLLQKCFFIQILQNLSLATWSSLLCCYFQKKKQQISNFSFLFAPVINPRSSVSTERNKIIYLFSFHSNSISLIYSISFQSFLVLPASLCYSELSLRYILNYLIKTGICSDYVFVTRFFVSSLVHRVGRER